MSRNAIRFLPFRLTVLTTLLLFGSCVAESGPTAPEVDRQTMEARGGNGGGGGGGGGSITVTGTEPGTLPRGATGVALTVLGSGFEPGSEVGFEVDGQATDRITVLDVTVIDENTIHATVDVEDDAPEILYDVAVRNGPKKKGVGIDLLRVIEPDVTPFVSPQVLSSAFTGEYQAINNMAGAWMVGDDELCDFVFNVDTRVKTCLDVPWATPTDESTVLLLGVDPSGVVVGYGEDSSGTAIPFRVDAATDPDVFLELEVPFGWDEAKVSWDRSINAQGLIVGFAQREVPREKGPKNRTDREYATVLWRPDGSVRSMTAPGDYQPSGGLSDELPDGKIRVGITLYRIWDGVDGSVPVELDASTLAEPQLSVIAPDGTAYGTDRDRVVRWDTPTSDHSVLVDLGIGDGLGIFAIDEHGNLLGRGDYGQDGIFGLCIHPSNASTDRTMLKPYAGAEFRLGTAPLGGRGGIVYGHSANQITFWDMRGAVSGCETS
jgi:hypothetical protein